MKDNSRNTTINIGVITVMLIKNPNIDEKAAVEIPTKQTMKYGVSIVSIILHLK